MPLFPTASWSSKVPSRMRLELQRVAALLQTISRACGSVGMWATACKSRSMHLSDRIGSHRPGYPIGGGGACRRTWPRQIPHSRNFAQLLCWRLSVWWPRCDSRSAECSAISSALSLQSPSTSPSLPSAARRVCREWRMRAHHCASRLRLTTSLLIARSS